MQDLNFVARLHQDSAVMKYLGPLRSRPEMLARIVQITSDYPKKPGYGIWMLCKRNNSRPIGWACLKDLDGTEDTEIGYRIVSSLWGHGYATEIARALLDYGFQHLNLVEISGVARPKNKASVSILHKCGMKRMGIGVFYNYEMVHFKILRTNWESQAGYDQSS